MIDNKKQIALVVLDGWGIREEVLDNAILKARTPCFDDLWDNYPHSLLKASGRAVGLPEGQMGNSEIGHTTIGAGRVIDTDLVKIDKAIETGELSKNTTLCNVFDHVKSHNSTLHLMGLLSDGGVHSHEKHLHAIIRNAKSYGVENISIHVFTDGRDTSPQSAKKYLNNLEKVLEEVGVGQIASISGRFYAMDRDNNWDRLKEFEDILFKCEGNICEVESPSAYVSTLYDEDKLDEHLKPVILPGVKTEDVKLNNNDGVFIFNFRPDRVRMLTKKVLEKADELNLKVATMTRYDKNFSCEVAFVDSSIRNTLAEVVSNAHLTQSHLAETEKFPHVTYFLNGGKQKPFENEKHILLDSRKDVPTHDLAPQMRAEAICDEAIKEIEAGINFIFINFANPDMVGHTANVEAIIKAVEKVDEELGRLKKACDEKGVILLVTADHGNAEINFDQETGKKHTAHTTSPVPFIINSNNYELEDGSLADIAPSVLSLFNIDIPSEMSESKVIIKKVNSHDKK